ncbi:MAG: sigma-70 family RNA polymerase sigma factor [Acutalibacteraceae bacterium]|nr:sigma-70 family RNA polymerase sigma factor [Acutalibacteraceae bacterium]
MTNEELAQLIKQGNKRYYATLWEQTSRLIHKLIYKHASKRKLPNDIDFDDILQCGYFAMVNAVNAYSPEKDLKFNTYLEFQVMNAIQLTIDRGQRKGMNTPRLQEYSYNRTVSNSEGEEVEIIDLMPDKQSPKIYEGAELTDLQERVWQAVAELPEKLREIITGYYFNGENLSTQAERLGVSVQTVTQRKRQGLRLLERNRALKQLYNDYDRHYHSRYNDLQTLQWKRSPESYAIMQDLAERRRKGEYISYGKEQTIFLVAFIEYMQTHSEKSADTISDLYSCSYRFRLEQTLKRS